MDRYRRLVESSPDGILVVEDERIAFVNAAAVDLFGANGPGQLLGRSLCEFLAAESQASVREHLSGWRVGQTALRLDAKIVRPDGTIRDINVTGAQTGDWGLETGDWGLETGDTVFPASSLIPALL